MKQINNYKSNGILKNPNANKLKHEFVLTRRHGEIVTIEKELFEWNPKVKKELKEYKERLKDNNFVKNFKLKNKDIKILFKSKPVLKKMDKETYRKFYNSEKENKSLLLEAKSYSSLHNDLVNKLYSKEDNSFKKMADKQYHEHILFNQMNKIKANKAFIKNRNDLLKPFVISIVRENNDGKLYDAANYFFRLKYKEVSKIATSMHIELSQKGSDYHHLSVKNNITQDVLLIFEKTN